MRYDYETMKKYAYRKEPIGKYYGAFVFSMSKKDYQDLQDDRGYYYLIYDDGNYIVRNNYIYALLSENGNLNEFSDKRVYLKDEDKDEKSAVVRNVYIRDNGGTEKANVIIGNNTKSEVSETKTTPVKDDLSSAFFDRISQEIDNILKGGFNYEVGTN
jgi:hypothetical protein